MERRGWPMSRMRAVAAEATKAALVAAAAIVHASQLSDQDALRVASAAARADARKYSPSGAMALSELVEWSRRRARARQTHPGKRGRR
jgi:hypothetical protein